MGHKHTEEYYSAFKKAENPLICTVWMNFMLSEISQSPKENYCMISLMLCLVISVMSDSL